MAERRSADARADVVLLVGTYRPSVAAARALARRGRRVLAATSSDHENVEGSSGTEFSRSVSARVPLPIFSADPDAYLGAIVEEARRLGTPVHVFPFYEPVFIHLSRNRALLPDGVTFIGPSRTVVETCIDKERALRAALEAGLPTLPNEVVRSLDALVDATERLGGVAIRPMAPHARVHGRKAILCATTADVRRELPEWPEGHERLLVQHLARGQRIDVHFAARDGTLVAAVANMAIRTDVLDGTGLAVESVTRPLPTDVRDQATRLLGHLGYTGVGLMQFLTDPGTGQAHLIELNARMGAHWIVADRHGVDLANIAVDIASGRPTPPVEVPTPVPRVRSAWTLGDVAGLRRAARDSRLSRRDEAAWLLRIVVAALRADLHPTWSWRDPAPALVSWWRYLAPAARRRLSSARLAAARMRP